MEEFGCLENQDALNLVPSIDWSSAQLVLKELGFDSVHWSHQSSALHPFPLLLFCFCC